MNNLGEVIQNVEVPKIKQPQNLDDINKDNNEVIEGTDITVENTPISNTQITDFEIGITPFPEWVASNHQRFQNINSVQVGCVGVEPGHYMLFTSPHPKGGKTSTGAPLRKMHLYEDAHLLNVLNLPGHAMDIHSNGFVITYDNGDGRFLKTYGVKTGLIIVSCVMVDNRLIPYSRMKLKRKGKGINVPPANIESIRAKMPTNADTEGLQLQYKQIQKSISEITTTEQAVDWLLIRQKDVVDINHHLLIDDVIIWLTT